MFRFKIEKASQQTSATDELEVARASNLPATAAFFGYKKDKNSMLTCK